VLAVQCAATMQELFPVASSSMHCVTRCLGLHACMWHACCVLIHMQLQLQHSQDIHVLHDMSNSHVKACGPLVACDSC
jgi:hypothetical protein